MSKDYQDPNKIAGVNQSDIVHKDRTLAEHHTLGEVFFEFLVSNEATPFFFASAIAATFLLPGPWEIYALVTLLYGLLIRAEHNKIPVLPHFLPVGSNAKHDVRLPKPGSDGTEFEKPQAEVYLGQERQTRKNIFFKFTHFLRHGLMFGGTGSGKSEALMVIGYNFIAAGGSFLWGDAKADINTPFKLAWMCKRFGREDDMAIIFFNKPKVKDPKKLSYLTTHTINPCTEGSLEEIATMVLSLMPDTGNSDSNKSFSDNAQVLGRALSSAMVDLRDNGHIALSWDVFRDHMTLPKMLQLGEDKRLSKTARDKVRRFNQGVAGVKVEEGPDKQDQMAYNQFGFIGSYLLSGMSKLTDDYSYIYGAKYGDVSYTDSVFRGRCVATFIPALKERPDEIKMLGKLDLVGKRAALAEGLPDRLEGTGRNALKRRIYTGREVPNLSVTDEYQEIQVEGNSVQVKQGRSLGYAIWLGLQNNKGLGDEKEQSDFFENTDFKVVGRNQGSETVEEVLKGLGKVDVLKSEGRTYEYNNFWGSRAKQTSSYHEVEQINRLDIPNQQPGQFHMVYEGRVTRMNMLYITSIFDRQRAAFPEQDALVMNALIQVEPINKDQIASRLIAESVYEEFVSGARNIECKANTASRQLTQRLGKGRASLHDVVDVLMYETLGVANDDDWVKSSANEVSEKHANGPVSSPSSTKEKRSTSRPVSPTADDVVSGSSISDLVGDITPPKQETPHKKYRSEDAGEGEESPPLSSATMMLDAIIGGETSFQEPKTKESARMEQLSFFDQANIQRKADEAAKQFREEIRSEDGFGVEILVDDQEPRLQLITRQILFKVGQMMGLTNQEVDPGQVDQVRQLLERRISREPVVVRDKLIEREMIALGLDKE